MLLLLLLGLALAILLLDSRVLHLRCLILHHCLRMVIHVQVDKLEVVAG